ncbi:MAG: helix-turn-helix domain-containing protein [Candidatus Limnocylindrales bacterium]
MATLEELRRAVFPLAAPAAAASAGAAAAQTGPAPDVVWVRVLKSRVPAFDALEPGDLALLPETALRALAAGGVEPASIVEALARSRAAGALLVGDDAPDPSAETALRRAAEVGLPAWRLAPADPGEVERSVIGYLVNARSELERRAADLEARLGTAALRGHDLAALAAIVAAFLGRAVAIEGPRGGAAAVHAPDTVPGAAAHAARYLANRRHVVLRTPLPGGGAIAVLGDPPASELERVASERVAALLALELGRDAAAGGSGDAHGRAREDILPADGPPWVVLMGRQLVAGAASGLDERERLRARIVRLAPGRRLRLRGDAGSLELRLVAATSAADPLGLLIAGRVAAIVERVIAVSRPFQRAGDRPLAEQEARTTLEAVDSGGSAGRSGDPVVRADRLPAYRLLGGLHNVPDGLRQARALLAPLLVGRQAVQRARLATLGAVLERPGLAEAASALGIHRNTLAYRIGRIEALGGWRLDDPELRFVLALAVRLVQDAQEDARP